MSFGGFGTSFGTTTTTSATPAFSFGSTPTKGFGQTGFGLGSSTQTPASTSFGFGTTTTPGFGQTGFGLGSSTQTPASTSFGFGATTAAGGTGFGSFGGGFGTSASTSTPAFSFNAPITTTQSLFSGFGQTQTSTPSFGGFGASKPFGIATTTTAPTFGTSFGSGLTLGSTGTFGAPGGTGGFGLQQQQQQQQPQVSAIAQDPLINSIFGVNVYNDERNQIIAKWNLLQALWGFGKGYYAHNAPPCEYTPQNVFCRLKSIVYSVKPTATQSDALIAVSVNKSVADIRNQQVQFESAICQILGNKPNVSVHVDGLRSVSDSKSIVLIYIQEKTQAGTTRRVPNSEVINFLVQPMQKQQLMSMGVENIWCFSSPREEQLREYIENPPAGIDPKVWKQANKDNPDPSKYIPIPLIGFSDIKWRLQCQENENKIHETLLAQLTEKISELKRQQITSDAKIRQYRENLTRLEQRLLKIYVALSSYPNAPFGPQEEAIKARLENLHGVLNKPQYFRNRVLEIVSTLCLHESSLKKSENVNEETLADIKEFLGMQFKALKNLREVVDNDKAVLSSVEEDMKRLPSLEVVNI